MLFEALSVVNLQFFGLMPKLSRTSVVNCLMLAPVCFSTKILVAKTPEWSVNCSSMY